MGQQRVPQRKIDVGGEHRYKHGCPAGLNFFESHAPFEDFMKKKYIIYIQSTIMPRAPSRAVYRLLL